MRGHESSYSKDTIHQLLIYRNILFSAGLAAGGYGDLTACPTARRGYAPPRRSTLRVFVMPDYALPYVPSEHLGFDPHRLERLTDAMQRQIDERKAPGRRHADRPPRQDRLSAGARRAERRRPGDDRRRDLPHLFDDQADRLGRRDDAGRGGTALRHRSQSRSISPPSPMRRWGFRAATSSRFSRSSARSPCRTSCGTPRA